jgi:membrane protein
MEIQPFGHLIVIITNLLPFLFMCMIFTFIYKFVPNTVVNVSSAFVGGLTAGTFWQVAGMAFAAFVVSTGRYSAIYSSFAVLILFLIWLYVGWLIVLAGAQVAYYHQYPSVYLLHLRRKHQTPLFREYLTLAILCHITRRFLRGKPPLKVEHLARIQQMPLTIVEALVNDLIKAHMLICTDKPKGVMLAKPPDQIPVADVLKVVQHQAHHGSGAFALGPDRISQLLQRRDAAVQGVLEGTTLQNLVADQPAGSGTNEERDALVETGDDSVAKSEIVSPTANFSDSNPEETPSILPAYEKRRSN